jgi:hypothetical protein
MFHSSREFNDDKPELFPGYESQFLFIAFIRAAAAAIAAAAAFANQGEVVRAGDGGRRLRSRSASGSRSIPKTVS